MAPNVSIEVLTPSASEFDYLEIGLLQMYLVKMRSYRKRVGVLIKRMPCDETEKHPGRSHGKMEAVIRVMLL